MTTVTASSLKPSHSDIVGRSRDRLLPPRACRDFLKRRRRFPLADVAAFAESVGCHPGMVVGRLHHDGRPERPPASASGDAPRPRRTRQYLTGPPA